MSNSTLIPVSEFLGWNVQVTRDKGKMDLVLDPDTGDLIATRDIDPGETVTL